MKYKLEFWPYGEFETVEAAERLNRRAAEGWELVNITGGSSDINTNHVMCRFTLYRRNPAAAKYRYTVDIVSLRNGADYIEFCGDSGWEKAVELNSGVCVFLSRDGSGRPLHTSREVEFEHQLQVLSENHVSTSAAPPFLYIAVICGFFGWMGWTYFKDGAGPLEENLAVWLIPAYAVLWLKESLVYGVNLLYIKYARRRMDTGSTVKRPGWMSRLSGIIEILAVAMVLYVALLAAVLSMRAGVSLLLVCAALLAAAALGAAGIWVQLFKNKMGFGTALSIAGTLFLVVPVLFA